ncbi:MAG TPA: pyrroline-5-carboxylate reductase [Afifellaceae bacterium]|nr:pyrroline-5-carboxylate reductase [Afifellaceae bacterium]
MTKTVLLVGCGNMGFAMLQGWRSRKDIRCHVVEPADALRERAENAGATIWASADDLPADLEPALVFLAVKPQVMGNVAPAYARFAGGTTTFVSIAAGVTIATLSNLLPGATPFIRCMPNTPAAIGQGMLVSTANGLVSAEAKSLATDLLAASGRTAWIEDEGLMDAVTAISGSGPAYVFHFIECLTKAAVHLGLPEELAGEMAMQTVAGAGQLAAQSDTPPATLREQVTSPGGTTAAALAVLMGGSALEKLVTEAAVAARDRGAELGRT